MLLVAGSVQAAEIDRLELVRNGRTYRLEAGFVIAATPTAAWRVLTDYGGLPALNPSIKEVRILDADGPNRHRIYARVRLCAYVFCKTLEHVQWMTQRRDGLLEAEMDPADSDFEYGAARWELRPAATGSHLELVVEVRPRFWVPPVVGPWLIREALRAQARRTVEGIERRVAEPAP
jgi:Polyketide cyclase / dehydrase and lipid transport